MKKEIKEKRNLIYIKKQESCLMFLEHLAVLWAFFILILPLLNASEQFLF